MHAVETNIPDVWIITPKRFGDARGFFAETFNQRTFVELGIDIEWVQDNEALSSEPGVVRGLHYQIEPCAQHKLVRVTRGAILDVAVDIRRGSPTFGQHVAVEISAEAGNQILVPIGFAHGYCTLQPDTEVFYKVSNYYAPECERAIRWNDATLDINWPVHPDRAILSDKDANAVCFSEATDLFETPQPTPAHAGSSTRISS